MGKSVIGDARQSQMYMTRYFFGALRYHIMHRGDLDLDPHDHPWWFVTFPLRSYVEEVLTFKDGVWVKHLNVVKAFRFHYRPSRYAHRILGPLFPKLPLGDMYRAGSNQHYEVMDRLGIAEKERRIRTIVLRGKVREQWGFYAIIDGSNAGDWIPSKQYLAEKYGQGYYNPGRSSLTPENSGRTP